MKTQGVKENYHEIEKMQDEMVGNHGGVVYNQSRTQYR